MDVRGNRYVCFRLGFIGFCNLLVLERGKEAFGHRVVPAVALATHARHEAQALDQLAIVRTGILAAAIGMKQDRKSTRLNSSHVAISYAVFCLKKKRKKQYVN